VFHDIKFKGFNAQNYKLFHQHKKKLQKWAKFLCANGITIGFVLRKMPGGVLLS